MHTASRRVCSVGVTHLSARRAKVLWYPPALTTVQLFWSPSNRAVPLVALVPYKIELDGTGDRSASCCKCCQSKKRPSKLSSPDLGLGGSATALTPTSRDSRCLSRLSRVRHPKPLCAAARVGRPLSTVPLEPTILGAKLDLSKFFFPLDLL